MDHVAKITKNIADTRSDPTTPESHKIDPARICRTIEAMLWDLLDGEEPQLFAELYEFAHLANWDCTKNHEEWLRRFLKKEEELFYLNCSPNDKKALAEKERLRNEEPDDIT